MKGLDAASAPVPRRPLQLQVAPPLSGAPLAAQRRAGPARGWRPLGGAGQLGGTRLSRRAFQKPPPPQRSPARAAMFVTNGTAAVRARGFPKSGPKTERRAVGL